MNSDRLAGHKIREIIHGGAGAQSLKPTGSPQTLEGQAQFWAEQGHGLTSVLRLSVAAVLRI